MFKRIVIITDSVGMPREDVPYEDSWIYLLKKEYPHADIIDRSARGTTSLRIVTEGGGGKDLLETYHLINYSDKTEQVKRYFQGPDSFFTLL